jgi:hypothetical protein
MRSVNITGKNNIDKINKIGNESYKSIRKHMENLDEIIYNHSKQLDIIREMFLNENNDDTIKSLFKSELNHKIQGYKGQDIKKEIHNADTLINLEDVIEKILSSKLTCCYCNKPILVLYKNVREPRQWTLDRIDNDLSHTKDNTSISCLKCNLQRRVMDAEKFNFTKKLKINKI